MSDRGIQAADTPPHMGRPAVARSRRAAWLCGVVAVALLAGLGAAGQAAAASWGPVRPATRSGQSFSPSVAVDADGRFALGYVRQLGEDDYLAEVRRGRLGTGRLGDRIVLDRSSEDLGAIAVTQLGGGALGAAWLRRSERTQGPRAATVAQDGAVTAPVNLVPGGTDSAFDPRWSTAPGRAPLLSWDRRTGSAFAALTSTAFGTPAPLPGVGIASGVTLAENGDGERVAVWSDGTRVLAAQAPAGGAFSAPAAISGPGIARDPQLAVGADGTAVVGWVRTTGAGNVMEVASRPSGGAIEPAAAISDPGEGAFAPRLVATTAGPVVAAWVAGPVTRGWGTALGPVRVRRLTERGTPDGEARTLTPPGVRTAEPTLADAGGGAVFVGWSSGLLSHRQIGLRRVGPRGGLGTARELAAGRWEATGAPVLAAAEGRAVIAWTANGVVRYRLLG